MSTRLKSLPIFVLMPSFICQFIFSDLGTFVTPGQFSPKVYSSHSIGQTFVSDFSGLTKIGVFVNKEDLKGEGRIIFHLRSSIDSNSDLIKMEVRNPDISDNWKLFRFPPTLDKKSYLYFFQFPPIFDSEGKSFYFFLEYSGYAKDDGIRLGTTEHLFDQGYSGGRSYFDSRPQKWCLLFQTYCAWEGSGKEAFREIANRLSMDKQFMFFYLLLCLIIFLALVYTSFLLHKCKKG